MNNDPVLSEKVCVATPCYINDYTSATSYLKQGTTNVCIVACPTGEYADDNFECQLCSTLVKKRLNNCFYLA